MIDEFGYYSTHGLLSNPGRYSNLFNGLPTSFAELCAVIHGVMIHAHWAERYGLRKDQIRGDEVQLRTLEKRLERILELDPRPLTEPRPPERRVVGNCRDYAQMLTAMLRHQGIPARARCGFGRYFTPGRYEDHWVVQCRDPVRHLWVWVDPQIDPKQRQLLSLDWTPSEMPADQFVTGGRAWQLARSGAADPERFGILDMHGLWFIRGNLIRDVAALNRMELLPWDCWGWMDVPVEELTAEQLALLDRAAALTSGEVLEFETLLRLYQDESGLRVPSRITSYVNGAATSVIL